MSWSFAPRNNTQTYYSDLGNALGGETFQIQLVKGPAQFPDRFPVLSNVAANPNFFFSRKQGGLLDFKKIFFFFFELVFRRQKE